MSKFTLNRNVIPISIFLLLALQGCQTADQRTAEVSSAIDRPSNISVAAVQAEIKEGMSGAEVIEALGTPNIITTDRERREVWTYDKVSTTSVTSTSAGGVKILALGGLLAGSGGVGGGVGAQDYSSASATSRSSKSLTIIIKFNENSLVRNFAYRYTTF